MTKTKPPPVAKKRGPKPKPADQLGVDTSIRLPPDVKREIQDWVTQAKAAKRVPFNYSMAKFMADAAVHYLQHLAAHQK